LLLSLLTLAAKPALAVPAAVIRSCGYQPREESHRHQPAPMPMASAPSSIGSGQPGGAADMARAKSAPPPAKPQAEAERKADGRSTSANLLKEGPADKNKGDDGLDVHQAGKKVDKDSSRASQVYLSNDDSMSLASAQRLLYAINNFLPIYRNEVRPHEFLNYFHFQTYPVVPGQTFSVKAQLAPREKGESLALAVQGRTLTKDQRRPAVITMIIDKSGSMAAQGKMEYLKEGLALLKAQLKNGDVLNVVEFDHETCNAIEGFVVGRDGWGGYDRTVDELAPRGSTALHDGLVEGYKLAERFYEAEKINRVLLITDAIANTGELSPELMASIGKYYDTKKIALSGIGVGLDFNDELLDTLTDKGKGAYLFIGLREALPRVFGSDFISLLDTVARDVHFQASFPENVRLDVFYGEEVSTEKAKVQPISYFANTSQLFLLDLLGEAKADQSFAVKVEYTDPISGEAKVDNFNASAGALRREGQQNVAKARLLMAFAGLLEKTSLPGKRPYSGWHGKASPTIAQRGDGKKYCAETLTAIGEQNKIYSDQETAFVVDLTNKYCARF
jgi:Mg-chelatase subunit ChlD